MTLTTQRDRIRTVAERWRETYEPFTDDRPRFSWRTGMVSPPLNTRQIAEQLDALDPETATDEEVNVIIGNDSWTRLTCDECDEDVDAVLTVGEEPDHESHTASLCRTCVGRIFSSYWPF